MLAMLLGEGGSFSMWGGSTCKLNEPPSLLIMLATFGGDSGRCCLGKGGLI